MDKIREDQCPHGCYVWGDCVKCPPAAPQSDQPRKPRKPRKPRETYVSIADELKGIQQGIADMKAGRVVSLEEVERRLSDQPAQGELVEALRDLLEAVYQADAAEDTAPLTGEVIDKARHALLSVAAPASQPVAPGQPERSAIDEANSILYPNRTLSSGADARELDRNTPEFIISTVNRLGCNAGCQHFDECEQEKIEPYLRLALPALLESFRAETLAGMSKRLESKLPCGHRAACEVGDEGGTPYCQVCQARAETLERAAQLISEKFKFALKADTMGREQLLDLLAWLSMGIRALSPDTGKSK